MSRRKPRGIGRSRADRPLERRRGGSNALALPGDTATAPNALARLDPRILLCAFAAAAAVLIVYTLTLQRSVPAGDSGELVAAAWVLGVPHPPGYPLFTISTHLAMLVPIGSPAFRANLAAATLDALTIAVVVVLIYRIVGSGRSRGLDRRALVAAVCAGLLLAFSTTFWLYALGAEVFPLNNLLAAVLLLASLEWARHPRPWILGLTGLLFGLALANQLTIVLLAPCLGVLVLAGMHRLLTHPDIVGPPRRVATRALVLAAGLFAVGLLPYLYLPWAAGQHPPINWGDPTTLDRFLAVVLRSDYGSFSLSLGVKSGSLVEQWITLGGDLLGGFIGVGVVLAAVGFGWLWRRDRVVAIALALGFVVSGPAFVAYANPDFEEAVTKGILARFYILPAIPVAVLAGAGAYATFDWATVRLPARLGLGIAGLLLALPLVSVALHVGMVDQSRNDVAQHYGEDLLRDLPADSVLLMRGDENYTSVSYVQWVEGIRPDVAAMDVELLKQEGYVDQMRRLHPDVVIPWSRYREGPPASLDDLVRANLGAHRIYFVGQMKEEHWTDAFDVSHAGLVREVVAKGTAGDGYESLRASAPTFAALRYPPVSYPDTTWESIIAERYGIAAFDLAYALQSRGAASDQGLIEQMYRTSIRLAPPATVPNAFKNLGVLLQTHGGDPHEIASLWTEFLRLSPSDPDAPAIRRQVEGMASSTP